MEQNDLQQHEIENDIQRLMQIREEAHQEIKKIGAYVATLDATNKRLVANFDVFEKLSKKAEDQIYLTIKTAGHDLMEESTKLFSPMIENLPREQILKLEQAIRTAEKTLCAAVEEKNNRPFYYTLLGWLFLISIGFGIGSIISHRSTTVLPQDFIEKIDRLEYKVEEARNRNIQEKQKKGK